MQTEKLPSGKYRAVVRYKGVKRTVGSFDTKSQAAYAGAQLLIEMGADRGPSDVTVGEMLEGHLIEVGPRLSPTTLADWKRVAARLPETITARRAASVNPVVVMAWWKILAKDGWLPSRIEKAHTVLSAAFAGGQTLGIVNTNPMFRMGPATTEAKEIQVPEHADVRRLLDAPGTLGVMVKIAAVTGARRGELVGIKWDDIDLDRAQLNICRSLVHTTASGIVERQTKTGKRGHRLVTLPLPTVAALRAHRKVQAARALERGGTPVWVVSEDGIERWRPDYATTRWTRWRDSITGTDIRLHALRHYVATTMLQDGVPLVDVAAQLGHSSQQTTARVYAKYVQGRNREAIDRLAARLG